MRLRDTGKSEKFIIQIMPVKKYRKLIELEKMLIAGRKIYHLRPAFMKSLPPTLFTSETTVTKLPENFSNTSNSSATP